MSCILPMQLNLDLKTRPKQLLGSLPLDIVLPGEGDSLKQWLLLVPQHCPKRYLYKTLYDNKYSSIINIYFYETFSTQTSSACALKHFLDTLSDILDKCLRFSLIKIESVSTNPSQAMLGSLFSSFVYTFRLKMVPLVLIKNCDWFVYLI